MPSRVPRRLALTCRHPLAILVRVQLPSLLLCPLRDGAQARLLLVSAIGLAVLMVTTGTVRRTPGLTWVSAWLALSARMRLVLRAVFDLPALLP